MTVESNNKRRRWRRRKETSWSKCLWLPVEGALCLFVCFTRHTPSHLHMCQLVRGLRLFNTLKLRKCYFSTPNNKRELTIPVWIVVTKFRDKISCNQFYLIFFLLEVNFDKFTIRFYIYIYIYIFYIFYTCKSFRKLKINSYIINKLLQVFAV